MLRPNEPSQSDPLTDLAADVIDRLPKTSGFALGPKRSHASFSGSCGRCFQPDPRDLYLFFRDLDPFRIGLSRAGLVRVQKIDDNVDDAQIRGVMDNTFGGRILRVGVNPETDVWFETLK
jgi:hypothetical protein